MKTPITTPQPILPAQSNSGSDSPPVPLPPVAPVIDEWLIRTEDNWIAGPYPAQQICEMILEGRLGVQDEVCAANHYWVYLHEANEIRAQLGVELPRVVESSAEEVTETETAILHEEPVPETSPTPSPDEVRSTRVDLSAISQPRAPTMEIVGGHVSKSWFHRVHLKWVWIAVLFMIGVVLNRVLHH
jgi:hypothetical protein